MKIRNGIMKEVRQGIFIILLAAALTALLSGCAAVSGRDAAGAEEAPAEADTDRTAEADTGRTAEAAGTDEDTDISAKDSVDQKTDAELKTDAFAKEAEDEDVREIYLDFMRGNRTLTVPDAFEGEGEYAASIRPGEYTYPALKAAYETGDGHDTTTQYAFADLGGDGIEELALCFENTDPSFMNWNGIIHCEDGRLELVHSYEDGYRTSSELYEAGFLKVGGSFGAGAYGTDYFAFSGKGSAGKLFTVNYFFSSFATQIAYDLPPVGTGYSGDDSWGYGDCALEITEYVPAQGNGEGVKISVENYSADPAKQAEEEQFVKELAAMGAEEISSDDMQKLTGHEGFSGPSLKWQDWEEVCTIVKALEFAYVYPKPADYLEAVCVVEEDAESEYVQRILITTNKTLKDVRVLALSACGYSEEGGCIYSAGEVERFAELTPDRPLVIDMIFVGDTPNQGISYVDENGEEKILAVAMSGMDGSIYLEEAEIR